MNTDQIYSIKNFCEKYGISRSMFYKLQKQGNGPKTFTVGQRRLISSDAISQWQDQLESPFVNGGKNG